MIFGLIGDAAEQDRHVQLATQIDPLNPSVLLDYGSLLFRIGELAEARTYFEKLSDDAKVGSKALSNLAAIAIVEGKEDQANCYLIKSLTINPNNSHALDLKLKLLGQQYSHDQAFEILLSEHKSADPSLVLTLQGRQLDRNDSTTLALDCFELAISIDQNNTSAQLGRAKMLSRLGRTDEAIEQLLISLTIEPGNIDLMLAMGTCLQQINQIDSAVYFYEQILEIEEIHSEASNLLGCCYRLTGREEESIPYFLEALKHDPGNCKLLGNLASALRNVSRVEESIDISKQILASNPLSIEGFYSFMFTQSIMPRSGSEVMLHAASSYWHAYRESLLKKNNIWTSLEYQQKPSDPYRNKKKALFRSTKIRIGILSAEIGAHVVGMFLRSFLENYNRSDFHVTLIIAHRRYELQENELVELADDVLCLHGLGSLESATAIKARELDIIIETSGYTINTQLHLLAFRLAPIQCHYIGYHASTGLHTIDYFIADSITAPLDFVSLFSEEIWRLPCTWLAISYHEEIPVSSSLAETECFTFASFNQGAKFNYKTFTYWASALTSVPNSLLLIKDRSLTSAKRREWITSCLEGLGIPRSSLRILGATQSWQDHMSIYNIVDACLDCTSWSGSTTVFDSLSMGTPYIAICGDSMASRMSSSILHGYGYSEWIASSIDEYASIAKKLASHQKTIRKGKRTMQQRVQSQTSSNSINITRLLEQAFKQMLKIN